MVKEIYRTIGIYRITNLVTGKLEWILEIGEIHISHY